MNEFDCSWLREEDFDELTNSMEVSDTTSHSLVYPEIKPMMINLTVYFVYHAVVNRSSQRYIMIFSNCFFSISV